MLEKPIGSNSRKIGVKVAGGERKFLLRWVLATIIAFGVGEFLFERLLGVYDRFFQVAHAEETAMFVMGAFGLSLGSPIGFLQWSVMRTYLPNVKGWFVRTLVGVVAATFIASLLDSVVNRSFPRYVAVGGGVGWLLLLLGGVVIGMSQYSSIRKALRSSWAWVIGASFGWGIAWISTRLVRAIFYPRWIGATEVYGAPGPLGDAIAYGVGGLILGTITGGALVWLCRHNAARP